MRRCAAWDRLQVPSVCTARRLLVLRAVKQLTEECEGIPPTVREVALCCDMTRSSTYRHISALCDIGLLTTHSSAAQRGVRIIPTPCYDRYQPLPPDDCG